MKLYTENYPEPPKSWSLKLNQTKPESVDLNAVDSFTGLRVVFLISFGSNGDAISLSEARERLTEQGYDPDEHKNQWNSDGSLHIIQEE